MKHYLQTFALLAFMSMNMISYAQTTVAAGNWSNPATWGGFPPMGSGTVVINHKVTLDMDYAHTSGSIAINASGALNGNSPMRVFALNLPSGTSTLTINGSFNVARVYLVSNTVNNNGTLQADSLLNSSNLSVAAAATINTDQFMNNASGTITNNGKVTAINFLNIETVNNAGNLNANYFTNSKSFTNSNTGFIVITNDFSNIDTLASPAVFANNGFVSVANDWHNGNQINGSGKFCIGNNTWNSGTMTGTFDFCDQTGGNIDLNTGTVAGTITYCVNPCSVGINELLSNLSISILPNPFSSQTVIRTNHLINNATLIVYNQLGQIVEQMENLSGQIITLNRNTLPTGLYFVRLSQNNRVIASEKLIISD
ncbi:MAG: T9SS type A sorting domain-containing protein [Bacteroidia bacterium]|nr:T9SS type A sorting domain-containing protein [Bacteroidia bacterium]